MRVTVCELSDDREYFAREWARLVVHARTQNSELVLLNEFPFSTWFPETATYDEATWQNALAAHDAWLPRLAELAPAAVLGTRPVVREGKRLNEAFVWTAEGGYQAAHHKAYLPEEPGTYECTWYHRGDPSFGVMQAGAAQVGFTVCTEIWFPEHARACGKQGAHIIAAPRATENAEKWLVGGQASAVIAGAFHLSSNRVGRTPRGTTFTGHGWVIDPDGVVLARTSSRAPFVTVDVDLAYAEAAKATYPRYVVDD